MPLILPLLVLAGCISVGNPAVRDEAVMSRITIGMTTKKDVRNLLGEPNSIMRNSGNPLLDMGLPIPPQQLNYELINYEIWNYTYTNLEASPATYIPLIGPLLFLGAPPSRTASATLFFDENGIVKRLYTHQIQSTAKLEFFGRNPRGNSKDRETVDSQ
jgi:hypothetical protein